MQSKLSQKATHETYVDCEQCNYRGIVETRTKEEDDEDEYTDDEDYGEYGRQENLDHHKWMDLDVLAANRPEMEYEWLEWLSDPERLYRPTKIGEIIDSPHGEYQIVHKLGKGSSSTVWLARHCEHPGYVAIKIFKAAPDGLSSDHERHMDRHDFSKESTLWETLSMDLIDENGDHCDFILKLISSFHLPGPGIEGQPRRMHECLISPLAYCDLRTIRRREKYGMFRLDTARTIVAQLVEAIAELHSRGFVHRGKQVCFHANMALKRLK